MGIYKAYWKKYKLPFLIAVACVFLEAVCDLLQPTIMAHIIDDGVKNSQLQTVLSLGGLMLLVTAFGAVFALGRNVLSSKVSQSFGADLRYDLFQKIMSFSLASADKMESGSLITRMTNDVTQVTQFVHGMMRIFFKAPLTCIGSVILAVSLNPLMSVVLFIAIGIISVFITISMKMSYARFAKVQRALDKVNTVVQEYLMGVRLVKAFGRFREEEERFGGVNDGLANRQVAAQRIAAFFSPLMQLTINIGIAVIIYVGSLLFIRQSVQVGEIVAFTNYMTQILGSLMMITNVFNVFVRTKASTERIQEVFSQEEAGAEAGKGKKDQSARLVFEHVEFAYPDGSGTPVLTDLSFSVSAGETLAVIGPTGAGKSTLAWLILGFYHTTGGAIYLDGEDIRGMAPESLREKVSIAPQKSMLFSGTVEENIKWGRRGATEEELRQAAKIAQADGFIAQMPRAYDSILGQSGVNLSGGQKQRISIARAVVKKAEVLLLDDCTSALDAVTEAKVRQGLRETGKDQTVIMITQRIGTAMTADRILVLDNGRSVGFGTHTELMENCNTYLDIYESQIGSD